jgi:uncharacterized Zn finger protein (UPF0148 family)
MNIEDQWRTFVENSSNFRCVIHCARCGSSNVDGRSGRIICFTCQNESHWSPDRFRFARDMRWLDEAGHKVFLEATGRDWRQGMEAARTLTETEARNDYAWLGDIIRATESFLETITKSGLETVTEHGRQFDKEKIRRSLMSLHDMHDRIEATLTSL